MKKVTLLFPDTTSLADFLLQYKPPNTDASTTHRTLSGAISEDLIVIACTQFGAELNPPRTVPFFQNT